MEIILQHDVKNLMKNFFDGIGDYYVVNTYVIYIVGEYIGQKEESLKDKEEYYESIEDENIMKKILNKICIENNEFLKNTEYKIEKRRKDIDILFRTRVKELYEKATEEEKIMIEKDFIKIVTVNDFKII